MTRGFESKRCDRWLVWSFVVCVGFVFGACEVGRKSGQGLRLPNGDVAAGREAFQRLDCDRCHSIPGEVSPRAESEEKVIVVLGGKAPHIETHGELVTSIVNPSHGYPRRYSAEDVFEGDASKMMNFNETMTVKELIDLTAFLQSKYELELDALHGL